MKTVDDNNGDDALKRDSKVFDGCETNLVQRVPLQIGKVSKSRSDGLITFCKPLSKSMAASENSVRLEIASYA